MPSHLRRLWLALTAGLLLAACAATAPPAPTATMTAAPSRPAAARAPESVAPRQALSGLPVVAAAELPSEAQDTLVAIARGGPFPYPQDDQTFQNREGILPGRPYGFYREYTVVTPDSGDRGARRIVAGSDGTRFYTDDHYNSFREVIE